MSLSKVGPTRSYCLCSISVVPETYSLEIPRFFPVSRLVHPVLPTQQHQQCFLPAHLQSWQHTPNNRSASATALLPQPYRQQPKTSFHNKESRLSPLPHIIRKKKNSHAAAPLELLSFLLRFWHHEPARPFLHDCLFNLIRRFPFFLSAKIQAKKQSRCLSRRAAVSPSPRATTTLASRTTTSYTSCAPSPGTPLAAPPAPTPTAHTARAPHSAPRATSGLLT